MIKHKILEATNSYVITYRLCNFDLDFGGVDEGVVEVLRGATRLIFGSKSNETKAPTLSTGSKHEFRVRYYTKKRKMLSKSVGSEMLWQILDDDSTGAGVAACITAVRHF
jgi:hypothetical protein